jgi:hypothetical protein
VGAHPGLVRPVREGCLTIDSGTAIDTLARLIEDAFEGDPDQSLKANLQSLRDSDWTALPPGGGRAIWCERLPTRTIIRIMSAHDFYHASEINRIRAPLQGSDR